MLEISRVRIVAFYFVDGIANRQEVIDGIFEGTDLNLGKLQFRKDGADDCYFLDLPNEKVKQWNKFANSTIRPRVDALRTSTPAVLADFGFGTRLETKKAA